MCLSTILEHVHRQHLFLIHNFFSGLFSGEPLPISPRQLPTKKLPCSAISQQPPWSGLHVKLQPMTVKTAMWNLLSQFHVNRFFKVRFFTSYTVFVQPSLSGSFYDFPLGQDHETQFFVSRRCLVTCSCIISYHQKNSKTR